MTKKAVFLDRDGTINVEKQYLHTINEFSLLPNVLEALSLLQSAGYLLIIITNQSGIARGYYTEKDFDILNTWMLKMFRENGISIADVYYCPHLSETPIEEYRINCNCRKPHIGLFNQAIFDYALDVKQCVAIGDRLRDCCICDVYDCKGYLIGNTEEERIIKMAKNFRYKNIKYAETLYEAAKQIIMA